MNDCTFNIERHIATLSGNEGGITKRISLISWNGKPAVFDIRVWSGKGQPYKGISLNKDEIAVLKAALDGLKL